MVKRTWDDNPELRAEAAVERDKHQAAALEVADARPPEFSDESLALRFSTKHGTSTSFVSQWGKWLLWDGSRWSFDNTLFVFDMARAICRVASAEVPPKATKLAASIASAKTRAAVVSLAREDRRHAATVDQWDKDQMLLLTLEKDSNNASD